MKVLGLLVLSLAHLLATAGLACAHGGGHAPPYNGPPGTVPPQIRPPDVTPPPPITPPGGGTTPSPEPGTSPPPSSPTTPHPPGTPTPGGASPIPGRVVTGRGTPGTTRPPGPGTGASAGFESWEFWWAFNRDRFLRLSGNLFRAREVTESSAFFFGRHSTRAVATDTTRPTPLMVQQALVPALRRALTSPHADVRDSACIALGKAGGAADVARLCAMIRDRSPSVRKAAVIALGILETPESIAPLAALLDASPEATVLRGGRAPETALRAWAAAALGLVPDDASGTARAALLRASGCGDLDTSIRVHAVLSLGQQVGSAAAAPAVAQHLLALIRAPGNDGFVRAHAVTALAQVFDRSGAPIDEASWSALKRLAQRDRIAHVQRSALIALGILGARDARRGDAAVILEAALRKGSSPGHRHFAAIGLGQIGGMDAFRTLRDVVLRGRGHETAYAGIGLGMLCERILEDPPDAELRQQGLSALRAAFEKARDPLVKGGLAIGLGIARDREAGSRLLEAMKEQRDVTLRGYLAVAMGMVGYTAAAPYLLEILDHSGNVPLLQQQTAIGLGLMGNRYVAERLVRVLRDDRSDFLQASATQALGLLGDRHSIGPLLAILEDERARFLTRGFACVALGGIGEDAPLPVLSELLQNLNYLASTPSIMALQRLM
ncbi:MAG: HEAT repeat domain-containing protein [Planctomycetes bacterium]|nr:HEAT repeat domain-containing protein [Planctomycetota bacterium]